MTELGRTPGVMLEASRVTIVVVGAFAGCHTCTFTLRSIYIARISVLHGEINQGLASPRTTPRMPQTKPPTNQPCSDQTAMANEQTQNLDACHLPHHTSTGTRISWSSAHAWLLRRRTGSDFALVRLPAPDHVLSVSAPVRRGAVADAHLGLA